MSDHGNCIQRRRLAMATIKAWDLVVDGHTINGMDRLVGPVPRPEAKCDVPGCGAGISDIVYVDGRIVLLCEHHFTPSDAIAAAVSRTNKVA